MTLRQAREWMLARLRSMEAMVPKERGISFMRRKEKPITRALIRKHFGKEARIWDFGVWYRVTTPGGGLVRIGPGERARLVYGGDEVYRALLGLAGECWGVVKAGGNGSREFLLGAIAHGEALGVNVQPDFRDWRATLARWVVAALAFLFICAILGPDQPGNRHGVLALLLAAVVFFLMKRKARQEEQHKLETGGFHYPRSANGGVADYADEDDLRKGGLI
jgi:hypothetical protein